MIPLWTLVILLVGVNFALWGTIGLARFAESRRRRDRIVDADAVVPPHRVAVLMAAYNEETVITESLIAIRKLLPAANIHVISDGSLDRTEQLAAAQGVHVLRTKENVGKAGALAEGIRRFGLLDAYDAVLLLDADTRLDPGYFDAALPYFDDPAVGAVAGYARTDWDSASGTFAARVLTAHRARIYAITQRLLKYGQTWRYTNVTPIAPGFASMYRTNVLRHLKIDPPGLVIEDFNMTFELHRKKLGKVGFGLGNKAITQDPDCLADYVKQTRRWTLGFWQTVRRHGLRFDRFSAALVLYLAELLLSSVLLLLLPVVLLVLIVGVTFPVLRGWTPAGEVYDAVRSLVSIKSILLGVLLPDYLLTLLVAAVERQPRYLLTGPFFLPLRLVDAATTLRTLPRAWLERSSGRWTSPVRRLPGGSTRSRPRFAGALGVTLLWGTLVAAIARAGTLTITAPAVGVERRLIDAAYGTLAGLPDAPVAGATLAAETQLRWYAQLTGAFERHGTVLLGGRELAVLATAIALTGAVLLARSLRVHPLAMACGLLALAITAPILGELAVFEPGVLAAALAAPAVLALRGALRAERMRAGSIVLSGIAMLFFAITVFTAPWVLLPLLIAGVVRICAGRVDVPQPWTAAVGASAATCLLLAAAGITQVLAMGVVSGILLVALSLDWLFAADSAPSRARARVAAIVLAALLIGGSGYGALASASTVAPVATTAHGELANWLTRQALPGAPVALPAGVWADVHRDLRRAGVPVNGVGREIVRPDALRVTESDLPGTALAVFGDGADGRVLAVLEPTAGLPSGSPVERVRAGNELAGNLRLRFPDTVRDALVDGRVDIRAISALADLAADFRLEVPRTVAVQGELDSTPYRTIVVSEVDGRRIDGSAAVDGPAATADLIAALRSRHGETAPSEIRFTDAGLLLGWRASPYTAAVLGN